MTEENPVEDDFIVTVDDQRSISLRVTDKGTAVITLEDPHYVAIVEMPMDDLRELHSEIGKVL